MSEEIRLILLVNKENKKVLFAGANKDFVDVLCSFLTMPLGTIARLVQQESLRGPVQVGCLNSLYESVVKLDKGYLWTETCKEMLLRPRNSSEHHCRSLKLNIDDTDPTSYFVCSDFCNCGMNMLSTFKNQRCKCGNIMDHSVLFESNETYEGFLRGGTTFVISDNLDEVQNTIHEDLESLEVSFKIFVERFLQSEENNLTSLEVVSMNVTKRQVLDLLKCTLLSKTTLSNFFFVEEPLEGNSRFKIPFTGCPDTFQIKVKIVVRKSKRKILYAEGAEDFADFLFSFLTLPLGGVVRMLREHSLVGCVDYLYNSIDDLDEDKYFKSKEEKNMLVDPNVSLQFQSSICKQILPICEQASVYYCDYQTIAATGSTSDSGSISHMQFRLTGFQEKEKYNNDKNYQEMKLVDPKSPSAELFKVHANLPAMFMVTDDLVVAPASLTSGQSLVHRLKIPLTDVTEKNVFIGVQEGLAILKASLTSRSALTNGLSHLLVNFNAENGFVKPLWCP